MSARRFSASLAVVLVAFGLGPAACGWAEWPPPGPQYATSPPKAKTPAAPTRSPSDSAVFVGAESVVVGHGDTLYAVSRRHQVSARAIIDANGLTPPYQLTTGQRLVLPKGREHVVARGDTLYGISRRYDVDMYVLARNNGLRPPYTIRVGQALHIPAAQASVRPAAASATPVTRAPSASWEAEQQHPAVTMRPTKPQASRSAAAPMTKKPLPRSDGGFLWPTRGKVISEFGPKAKGLHNDGVNISAPRGSEVLAAESGVVAYAGNEIRGFGNLLLIKHADGWITAYAHNEVLLVKRGDRIQQGQIIARVGSSGNVSTPQLHFEIRRGRAAVDPRQHLREVSGPTVSGPGPVSG